MASVQGGRERGLVTVTTAVLGHPAAGQLARVRGRHWVVTDVAPTSLPYDVKSTTVPNRSA